MNLRGVPGIAPGPSPSGLPNDHDAPPPAPPPEPAKTALAWASGIAMRFLRGFLREDRGGAMLTASLILASLMAVGGGSLIGLAWDEMRGERLSSAIRAAMASLGAPLLRDLANAQRRAQAERQIEQFVEANALPENTGTTTVDTTISYDANTGIIDVEVTVDSGTSTVTERVRAEYLITKYEMALSVDLTQSMRFGFIDNVEAIIKGPIANNVNTAQTQDPGSVMVSVVPWATSVKLAEISGATETAGKRRYLAAMGGRANAKWVDMFHDHGVGGGLQEVTIPPGWDWDDNRWTGCLMARWGAYWDPNALPPGVTDVHADVALLDFPALDTCPPSNPTCTRFPLHLSDAAPDASDPNTWFTAYSWPDATPHGNIDARLQLAMAAVLVNDTTVDTDRPWFGANDWNLIDDYTKSGFPARAGGDIMCSNLEILPLTANTNTLDNHVNDLKDVLSDSGGVGGMYSGTWLHLGVVWGMRALSADWQSVWNIPVGPTDPPRPLAPARDVKKTIILLSDGRPTVGNMQRGLIGPVHYNRNPYYSERPPVCIQTDRLLGSITYGLNDPDRNPTYENFPAGKDEYFAAAQLDDAALNNQFGHDWETDLAQLLGAPDPALLGTALQGLTAATPPLTPARAFRNLSLPFADELAAAGLPRPHLVDRHMCDWTTPFGPYGRVGDPLYVGGEPLVGYSPLPNRRQIPHGYYATQAAEPTDLARNAKAPVDDKLNFWYAEACDVAADRNVRVNNLYLGPKFRYRLISRNQTSCPVGQVLLGVNCYQPYENPDIVRLRACSTITGGELVASNVNTEIEAALQNWTRVSRNLRFL